MTSKRLFTDRTSDASTRRLWYKIGVCHDWEANPALGSRGLRRNVFGAHHLQVGLIFVWASLPLYQLCWQGVFEDWCRTPQITPLAHAVRDPHLGALGLDGLGNVLLAIRCTTGLYQWLYTLGLRTTGE